MTGPTAALVYCPFPSRDSARTISESLLDEKLIACANILGDIESVFVWNGETSSDKEVAVLFKTVSDQVGLLISRLGQLHPYDTPAIVGWDCDTAHPSTLSWLGQTLGRDDR